MSLFPLSIFLAQDSGKTRVPGLGASEVAAAAIDLDEVKVAAAAIDLVRPSLDCGAELGKVVAALLPYRSSPCPCRWLGRVQVDMVSVCQV